MLSTITSEPLNRYTPGTTLGVQTYASANPLNQYPSVTPIGGSATTLSYDLNGNLTGDGSSTYSYDATNRLLSIAGLVTASYGYDALDRRMQKTAAATTTRYLHAGSDEIAEYSSAGALLRRYVPAPGADERAAMIDSGLASPPATAIKYAHIDRQGSVMSVTDSTGAVTERFAYDGFGRSSSALSGYPFRYTGQRLDFESGLMFYKARVYSTALGRFLQTDPIGTKDDLNLYAYVGNDPVNKTDPTGQYGASEEWDARQATACAGDPQGCMAAFVVVTKPFTIVDDAEGAYEFYQDPTLMGGIGVAVGIAPVIGDSLKQGLKVWKNEGKIFEVLSSAPVSGTTRGAHRAAANKHLAEQLRSDSSLRAWFDDQMGHDVLKHMESGGGELKNPFGTEWHHPKWDPDNLWLLRTDVHRDPGLRDILHQDGTGGFADFFKVK